MCRVEAAAAELVVAKKRRFLTTTFAQTLRRVALSWRLIEAGERLRVRHLLTLLT